MDRPKPGTLHAGEKIGKQCPLRLLVESSMKVVPALNAPDVRHEITLLGGVWEPPAQGKGGINRKAPRRGGVSKGVRGVLHQRSRGNSSMEPPAGTLHLPNSEPFELSHERQPAGQWRRVQKNMKRVRFTVFLPHTCT